MRKVLAFVVAGASRKERSAFDARLERRRFPQVERFGRLNVVAGCAALPPAEFPPAVGSAKGNT